jgi:hypothetical protein
MAMWDPGKTPCGVCGKPVMDQTDFLAFTCLGTLPKAYAHLDDAVVHQSCMSNWANRYDFVKHWNMAVRLSSLDAKNYTLIVDNGRVRYKNR